MEGETMSKKENRQNGDIKEVETTEATKAVTARVTCDRLNLRKAASTMADVIYIISRDEEVIIIEEMPQWAKVHYPKLNLDGYVMSHLIAKI